jgi:hypothetical protein
MVILSWSVTLIWLIVSFPCIASLCMACPPTLASEGKSDAQTASSGGVNGGILRGGLRGSEICVAEFTGTF